MSFGSEKITLIPMKLLVCGAKDLNEKYSHKNRIKKNNSYITWILRNSPFLYLTSFLTATVAAIGNTMPRDGSAYCVGGLIAAASQLILAGGLGVYAELSGANKRFNI